MPTVNSNSPTEKKIPYQNSSCPFEKDILPIERNVGSIDYHVFRSYPAKLFLRFFFIFFSVYFMVAYQFPGHLNASLYLSAGMFFVLLLDIYLNRKKLLFDVSFIYTVKTGGHEWWTPITDQIVLGGIPLESHSDRLQKSQISHMLTLLEPFELVPGMITPIHRSSLEKAGIENEKISCQDFLGVPKDKLNQAVEYIHHTIQHKNHKIYVHCKAGRGRSATVVVAYLLKYGYKGKQFNNFEEAYSFVKSKRSKVNLNSDQQKAIEDYYFVHGNL